MTRWRALFMASVWMLVAASQACAIPVINVGDLCLQPGGTGFVDVTIRSDTGTDWLDTFSLELRITTGSGRQLEFVDPPTDPQLTDPAYVLYGNSMVAGAPPTGIVLPIVTWNDTYIGGDGVIPDFLGGDGPITIPTTETLLMSLAVTADTLNAPQVGDTFTISLEPSPSTVFYDPNYADLGFESTSGEVEIVPEPIGTVIFFFLLATLGMIGQSTWRFWKRVR